MVYVQIRYYLFTYSYYLYCDLLKNKPIENPGWRGDRTLQFQISPSGSNDDDGWRRRRMRMSERYGISDGNYNDDKVMRRVTFCRKLMFFVRHGIRVINSDEAEGG